MPGNYSKFFEVLPGAGHGLVLEIASLAFGRIYLPLPVHGVQKIMLVGRGPLSVTGSPESQVRILSPLTARWKAIKGLLAKPLIIKFLSIDITVFLYMKNSAYRKIIRKELKILKLLHLGYEAICDADNAGLVLGFAEVPPRPIAHKDAKLHVGFIVHLHYFDAWDDIEACLKRMHMPFGLLVTMTHADNHIAQRITDAFPFARIKTTENCGRDIRPFFELLDAGDLDEFDIVCKLHGKKSLRAGRATLLGDLWRRACLLDLFAADGRLSEVISKFQVDATLGIAGPARFRVPNMRFDLQDAWSGNQIRTLQVARELGFAQEGFELDFFAGTMFWVRPAALTLLRQKGLSGSESYGQEQDQIDGALEHALERLFLNAAKQAGFRVGELPVTITRKE